MKISAKTDYACRALFELSLHWPNTTPLAISVIAEKQNIPIKFLTHILVTLKQLGYTQSLRGKAGGYLLAKSPEEIKLSVLLAELETQGFAVEMKNNNQSARDAIQRLWQDIDRYVAKAMDGISFETIVNRQRKKDNVVSFDI